MLLVVVLWGANFSVTKATFAEVTPLAFTAIRFVVGAAVLLFILRAREGNLKLSRNELISFVWLGFVGNTVYQLFFIYGLQWTTAANSALLISATPLQIALVGKLLGLEILTRRMLGGIALGLLGVGIVISSRGADLSALTLRGDLLILCSSVCWMIYTLGVRKFSANAPQVSPLRVTTWTVATGAPGLLIVGANDLANTNWTSLSVAAWSGLAYSTLLSLVVAYLLWNASVQRVGGNRTAIFSCLVPVVATLVAWLMLGERITMWQVLGAVSVIAGVLLSRSQSRKGMTARSAAK